ncbi:DNA replication factor A [Scheffersomyces xylosifermentans]|uniref:DNA replication factor A n=1 Tax=Scheffersomyces xylosifermentans TaxID=1304137 RepID=UPI00315DB1E1
MSGIALSRGVLRDVFSVEHAPNVKTPLYLQVTNIKPVFLQDELKKYRLLLNDGQYTSQGLVDESCVAYLQNNNFSRYAVIQVNEYSVFPTQKHIFIIKKVELVAATSEKTSANDFISVDTYFAEHPEDDNLQIAQRQSNGAGRSESPIPTSEANAHNGGGHTHPNTHANSYPSKPSAPAGGAGQNPGRITPIETLSPYQNNWTIKARVSYKGDLRHWSNAKGEGNLFSVNLLDESDEIKASAFNETAESAHKILEEGKVYYITKAKVQSSNKKFNHLSHPYELVFDRDTQINECFDTSNVPKLHFNFVKLNQIQNLEPNAIVDVIGALKTVNEAFKITAKSTGKEFNRRNITIVDETGFAIDVGLWNTTATDFSIPEGSVIAFKSCKVQEFNGRSLTLTQAGSLIPNPDTPESYQLKGWYDNEGINENFKILKVESSAGASKIANRISIAEAQEVQFKEADRAEFFSVKGSISFIKQDNFCYPACPNEVKYNNSAVDRQGNPSLCNKKMIEQTDGNYRCERCDKVYHEPTYRYILNCSIMDSTGQIWITLFDAEARKVMEVDAGELRALKLAEENGEDSVFKDKLSSVSLKEFVFRLKAKQDSYNDQVRIRYQATGVDQIDYNAEAEYLCSELDQLL